MTIEFLDLVDGGGWEPLFPDVDASGSMWSEGGKLADAPVDVAATFDGAAWRATGIDPTFGLTGVRLRAGFTVPRHHHSRALLLLVVDGSLTVRTDEPDVGSGADGGVDDEAQLEPGQFCVIEADTAYSLSVGAQDATFLASWPQEAPELVTCWHPDTAWVTR